MFKVELWQARRRYEIPVSISPRRGVERLYDISMARLAHSHVAPICSVKSKRPFLISCRGLRSLEVLHQRGFPERQCRRRRRISYRRVPGSPQSHRTSINTSSLHHQPSTNHCSPLGESNPCKCRFSLPSLAMSANTVTVPAL